MVYWDIVTWSLSGVSLMKRIVVACLLLMSAFMQNATLAVAQNTVVLYPSADSYADSKYPKSAYGSHTTFLYVGNSYDHAQDIWGSERIYIRFDLKGLPKNHMILQATLHLWQYYAPKSEQVYETHRVLGNWNEATENWSNQPSWAPAKTSEAVAPARTEVAVEWDITNDVRAWYQGEARNYGTMIKVAKEEHATEASSGFWSREYPVGSHEEWRPKLVILLQGEPTMTYAVSLTIVGLPNVLTTTISVDGQEYKSVLPGNEVKMMFDRGTNHTVAVDRVIPGPQGVRYTCDASQVQVSAAASYIFAYTTEYSASISTQPKGVFNTLPTGWYKSGTTLQLNRTGGDVIDTAPGTRLVFDAWYLNTQKLRTEPTTITVDQPISLEARYKTEYFLNVTSTIGSTTGTGWYVKDGVVSISVDRTTSPAQGILGLLGLRRSFSGWTGSQNFVGTPMNAQSSILMSAPATVTAGWQDDWSGLFLNVSIILIVVFLASAVGFLAWTRRRGDKSRSTPEVTDVKHGEKKKVR